MSEFENQSGMAGGSAIDDIQEQFRSLRALVAVAPARTIGFTFCADYFLAKQIQIMDGESAQMQMMASSFPQTAATDFVKRLKEYAKTHPDFASVAARYPGIFEQQPQAAPKK